MSKTRIDYGHVTFPLSLTQEEREQYKEFCESNGQTMSGRIKELMRKDMGYTVLSPFKEKYQQDIISSIKTNGSTLIVKSRQMWVTQLLLSYALNEMLSNDLVDNYSCAFICLNSNLKQNARDRFAQICADNGVQPTNNNNGCIRLSNGSTMYFSNKPLDGAFIRMTICDEFAYSNMTRKEYDQMVSYGGKFVMASTPREGSIFNDLVIDALEKEREGKDAPKVCVAHWSMNSKYNNDDVMTIPYEDEDHIRFSFLPSHIAQTMRGMPYMEQMECVVMKPKKRSTSNFGPRP